VTLHLHHASSADRPGPAALLLTLDQAAEALQIGRTTLFALLRQGRLRSRYIGARRYVATEDLRRFVDDLPTSPAA
jgi:excisionase family DNA binding protein